MGGGVEGRGRGNVIAGCRIEEYIRINTAVGCNDGYAKRGEAYLGNDGEGAHDGPPDGVGSRGVPRG